jgi:hypothetical protein
MKTKRHRRIPVQRRRDVRERRVEYDGTQPAYSQSTIPLLDSASGKTIRIRFHFQSDTSVSDPVHQGWWVDDTAVTAEPGR